MNLNTFLLSIKRYLLNKKANVLLLATASAIIAIMGGYFFVSITTMTTEEKERITHLYNAYEMGNAIDNLIKNTITTKGSSDAEIKDSEGNSVFKKSEFEQYIKIPNETIMTLEELINDKLITEAPDPTATRLNGEKTKYDHSNTTIKIVFSMNLSNYDTNGNLIKTVDDIYYYVNLAGQSAPTDIDNINNAPYNEGEPFYYLVSFADDSVNLDSNKITLREGNIFYEGVRDSTTNSGGPQANRVIILPGDS